MRIWYAANIRLPTEKAHGYQIMKMCEAFAEHGARVTLIVPDRTNPITDDPFDFYGVRRIFEIIRLPVIQSPWYSEPSFTFFQPLLITSFAFRVRRFFMSHAGPNDIAYTRDPELAWMLSGRFRTVYEAHGWNRMSSIVRLARRRLVACIAVTGQLADLHIRRGFPPERVFAEHDAADSREFSALPPCAEARVVLGLPADAWLVGYVGKYSALGMSKGVDTVIDAISRLPAHARGVIVGAVGDELRLIQEHAATFCITDRLMIIPFVRHAQAILYMRAMNALVLPSPLQEFFAYHSSPVKLFEYMASGTPIVASDLPAIREVVAHGDSALLVPPGDPDALARSLISLMDDPARAEALASRAADAVRDSSWAARAERIASHANHSPR